MFSYIMKHLFLSRLVFFFPHNYNCKSTKNITVTIKNNALAAQAPSPQPPPAAVYSGIHGFECMWENCYQVFNVL